MSANAHTPSGRWLTPVAVNVFMLIVAANVALANRLISSALPNVPFGCPKQVVLASNIGRFTAQNRPFQVAVWLIYETGYRRAFF